MAVISCPYCKKYISSLLLRCPECGKELPAPLSQPSPADDEPVLEEPQPVADQPVSDLAPEPTVEQHATEPASEPTVEQNVSELAPEEKPAQAAPIVVRKSANPFHKRYQENSSESPTRPDADLHSGHEPEGAPRRWWQRRKHRLVLYALLLVILGAGGFFLGMSHHREAQLEQRAFERLHGTTNADIFEDYFLRFPDGAHADEAQKLYRQFKADKAFYLSRTAGGTRAELVAFVKENPKSPFCQLCNSRIDSLDWLEASNACTAEAIDQYLKLHPKGLFVADANDLKSLQDRLVVSDEERGLIDGILDAFLSALSVADVERLSRYVADGLVFCGKQRADVKDVTSLYDSHFSYADIIGVHFSVSDLNVRKQPVPGNSRQYRFAVDASLEATLNRSAVDSLHLQQWTLKGLLGADRRFLSIDMQKKP